MKVVIVGGVAGGATAAARLRRLDEAAQIIVFERTGFVSYANCGLPYYVGGVIEDEAELTLQTPESFRARFNVDVRVHHEVTAIDPKGKSVTVRNLETGKTFTETYDKLVLSPGARPVRLGLPDPLPKRVFTLRTVEDTLRIYEYVRKNDPGSVVIAGGGYIGLELAENLLRQGLQVTLVQRGHQLLTPLDADMAAFVHAHMRRAGVRLIFGHAVQDVSADANGVRVLSDNAPPLSADMAVIAVGVEPDTKLAAEAGLALGEKGSIVVDDHMRTSEPDIYAVGDAVQVQNGVTGEAACIPLAGPANRQGRIAADNICGGNSVYRGSFGSSVVQVFDMTAASTGLNARAAKAAGINYDRMYLAPMNHASYYPGGKVMSMKVLFEKGTYRLLGAQIVGFDGVDKRIDVLATAMQAGLTVRQLKDLDLAYAPPYASAKDPVNLVGYIADNIASGKLQQFFWDEVEALPRDGSVTLLDVRTPGEYARGHIEGFRNIELDTLRDRLAELPKGKPIYVHCQSGLRSYVACRILSQNGFDCFNLSGGYRQYAAAMTEREAAAEATLCGMEK